MTTTIRSIEDDLARRHMYIAVTMEFTLRKHVQYGRYVARIIEHGREVATGRAESKGAAIEKAYEQLPKE